MVTVVMRKPKRLLETSRTWAFQQTISQSQEVKRIAYGTEYNSEKYPYVVTLHGDNHDGDKDGNHHTMMVCTGSMVSPRYVLTAAHCVYPEKVPTDFTVFLGSTNTAPETVVEIYVHPLYNDKSFYADICMVKLRAPFPGLDRFAVIAGHPDDFANNKELNCVALGFGHTDIPSEKPVIARQVNVIIRYKNTCIYKDDPILGKEFLCGKVVLPRPCEGDSGGPLICGEYQYGIIDNHQQIIPSSDPIPVCGNLEMEDEYLFLYNYKDWIFWCINSCPIIRPHKFFTFITFYLIVILVTFL